MRFCLHKGQNLSTSDMFICDLDFCVIAEILAIFKTRNGESGNENGERGTGNGESLKRGIFKSGNL